MSKSKWLFILAVFLTFSLVIGCADDTVPDVVDDDIDDEVAFDLDNLAPISDNSIFFRGWQFMTHIVEDNVSRYNSELGGNIDYATVTGDYPALMETQLAAGAELDLLYANPSQACRYYDGGWILPIDEFPNADEIKNSMYDNVREAWTYKDKLLGTSYFVTTRGTMHVNLKLYEELGFTEEDFPKNWDELYEQLYEIRDRGVAQPFNPHWFAEWHGLGWGYIMEVMNRGGRIADPDTHQPLLTDDGPGGDTLRAWKNLWNDNLIPRESITYRESDYMEAWGSGEFVFSPQQMYDLMKFNDPRYSTFAGYCSLLPYQGQSWGIIDSAMYLTTSRDRSPEHDRDVMAFASWYGFKDHDDQVFVGQRWVEEAMLFSAYRDVMESSETEAIIKAAIARDEDYDAILGVYENTPYPSDVFNVVWAEEFNSFLRETLSTFLTEDRDVAETIEAINNKVDQLNQQYGI